MKPTLVEMHSMLDAMRSLYMSKRSWDDEKEQQLCRYCDDVLNNDGKPFYQKEVYEDLDGEIFATEKAFWKEAEKVFKYGHEHTTILRFLDMSVTVRGLHRGAMDDFDSHAKRLENRIVRASTRLGDFKEWEMSDWYAERVMTTEQMLSAMDFFSPDRVEWDGATWVKVPGGYVHEEDADNRDVKRGLLPLCIPCDFTFKVNVIEWAHIYRERGSAKGGANGKAHPELQEMVEQVQDQLEEWYPQLNREYLLSIRN